MKKILLFSLIIAILAACAEKQPPHARYDIIPLPANLVEKEGDFTLKKSTTIYIPEGNEAALQIAEYFALQVKAATGMQLSLAPQRGEPKGNHISFELVQMPELGSDGYKLNVETNNITVQANEPNGWFYAVQTMYQLLPPAIYSKERVRNVNWTMACTEIVDYPRFRHRGMHLDVCRHFFPVDFVKKYIDLLAMQKMNRFHWHLTDDQGWRIESKKYPKLNEVGSWRSGTMAGHYTEHRFDTIRYGGYFTQDEIKEVVAYAASRYIEVIPEIEMPGHAQAAVASYPWLCCRRDTTYEVWQEWGVSPVVFCTTDSVFTFLEDVIAEIIPLFPSEYIHIGGDECPKDHWKKCAHCQAMIKQHKLKDEHGLQSYFIQRIEKFVNAKGKKIIGWDEILEGGLAPNATVMSWRGEKGGIEAAMQGHDVIMTPTKYCYLDYYQAKDKASEPLSIGGYVPLGKVYSFNPVPDSLPVDKRPHILGMQGNIWTEYIKTPEHLEYMVFPRSAAIAEIDWTPGEKRDFENFKQRLQSQFLRYGYMGVNASRHMEENNVETKK